MDKLTLEEIEKMLNSDDPLPSSYALYQQLADTMRENERLSVLLGAWREFHKDAVMIVGAQFGPTPDDHDPYKHLDKHPDDHRAIGTRIDGNGNIAQELICIYKDCPEHGIKESGTILCGTCNNPMPQTAVPAAEAWCCDLCYQNRKGK